jgi:acetyltransferase-like isoleucine patch superfamily enzyme
MVFNIIRFIIYKILKKIRLKSIRNSEIHKTSKVESGSNILNVSMGRHSFCGYDCEIVNAEIGSFCSIANNVKIGGGEHPYNWVSTSPVFYKGRDSVKMKYSIFERESHKRTIIGHDVWIAEGCLIKQGVSIGHGAIVGMGSVVTKDVPAYSIVGGVPAKIIKKRFDDDVIESLLKIEWWNFEDAKLHNVASHIKYPRKFIDSSNK